MHINKLVVSMSTEIWIVTIVNEGTRDLRAVFVLCRCSR